MTNSSHGHSAIETPSASASKLASGRLLMSDQRLREFERRWKETGAANDEVAYLLELIRRGESLDWESYSRLAEIDVQAATDVLLGRREEGAFERVPGVGCASWA
ncbi:hypothetical protein OAX78_01500 [Planctomycetota bacterium]|nr:hypothetical protein [Planctomycetota bacterium]